MITPAPRKPGFYRVPMTEERIKQLLGVPGIAWELDRDLCIKPTFATMARNTLALVDDPEARRILEDAKQPGDWAAREARWAALGAKPRTTQHQAIDFIDKRRGTLLADDMRVGKTGSCVGAHDPSRGPLVIVGPLASRAVWLGWIKRLFPGEPVGVVVGRTFDPAVMHMPFVFAHYDVIHHWQAMFRIGTLVFDEAHALSNPETKRTQAAVVLQSRAEKVIPATGTPVWNRPASMWSLLNLAAPGAWGSIYDFADRYGAPVTTAYGKKYEGVSHPEELHARLGDVMIRRRWQDVNQDLPPISRDVRVAEVSEAERKKLDILAGKLKGEHSNTAANLAAYRRQITKLKTATTIAEAQRILDRGEPVVVWTWHKDFAETLAERLNTQFVIHGDISVVERERRMQAWKECRDHAGRVVPMALVATMSVGQVAIDLSHARFAIFAEVDYIPAVIAQAEMRTFDASRPMCITFVIANHIVDQRLVRALVTKLASADPLGVAAARDSIDALRDALMGPEDPGDLDRLLEDLIASAA